MFIGQVLFGGSVEMGRVLLSLVSIVVVMVFMKLGVVLEIIGGWLVLCGFIGCNGIFFMDLCVSVRVC